MLTPCMGRPQRNEFACVVACLLGSAATPPNGVCIIPRRGHMLDDAGVVGALVPLLPMVDVRRGEFCAGYLRLLAHPDAGVRGTVSTAGLGRSGRRALVGRGAVGACRVLDRRCCLSLSGSPSAWLW